MSADSQGFLAVPGKPPVYGAKRPQVNLTLVTSAPPMLKDFGQTVAAHAAFREALDNNTDLFELRWQDDLYLINPEETHVVYGLQHAPYDMSCAHVRCLYDVGIRSMALAYDDPTPYGDGFKGDGGLTEKGKELIRWMSDFGIILDLSHTGHATARDALDFVEREGLSTAVMASHSGCYEVFPHRRNLPDDIIARLGYIGIPAISFFLTAEGNDSLEAFTNHVQHALRIAKRVGIGSDCPHVDMTMTEAKEEFGRMQAMLKTNGSFGEYFPDRPQQIIEHGSRMFEIFDGTLRDEMDGEDVENILVHNFVDFLSKALPTYQGALPHHLRYR